MKDEQIIEQEIYGAMNKINAVWAHARFKAPIKEWEHVLLDVDDMLIALREIKNNILRLPGHEPPCAPETIERKRLKEALKEQQQQ